MIKGASYLLAVMIFASTSVPALADSFPQPPDPHRFAPFAAGSVSDVSLRIMGGAPRGTARHADIGGQSANRGRHYRRTGRHRIVAGRVHAGAFVERDGRQRRIVRKVAFTTRSRISFRFLGMSDFAYVFVTNPEIALENPQDVIAVSRAKPGSLNFGTSAPGSSPNSDSASVR